tara:strand:- start:901 stop:2514 length:1614 start_codon:yes stop_codon:yes gene_type:complete
MIQYKNVVAVSALLFTSLFPSISSAQSTSQEANQKFNQLLNVVSAVYVDSVDEMRMVDDAIVRLLADLDPHSVYIPKKDKEKMNEPLQGKFEGVGIQFNIFLDTILVVSPISGGPSEKLGILSGDKIVTIENDTVAGTGINNSDVVKYLRGKKGTIVNVGIKRSGETELLRFDIKRDKIPIYSVEEGYLVNEKIGYVKVTRFARNTVAEFNAQLSALQKEGMEDLILDLRGNGGGYLSTAISLADQFLNENKLLVYTQGRSMQKDEALSSRGGSFRKGKLVILIDEGSASASEIVSGAIQDWDRGLIVGRRSFGKGLVQKPFPLPDGSEFRLTISRYYTPSGRCIQKPYDKGKKAYRNDINERFKSGELTNPDSIQMPDLLKFSTKINGRTVYGGGGIMPDVFVPIDTSTRSDYYMNLLRKGVFNTFSLSYLDKNRNKLSKIYNDKYEFAKNFVVTDELLADFIKFGEKKKVDKVEEDLEKSKVEITNLLKAYLARGLFNAGSYFQTLNSEDDAFKKAVDILSDDTFDKLKVNYKTQ